MTGLRRYWILVGLLAMGCGAARAAESPPPTEPSAAPEAAPAPAPTAEQAPSSTAATSEYRTLAEAESALDQAKAELDRLAFGGVPPAPASTTPGAGAPAPAKKEAERAADASKAEEAKKADGGCHDACRAFSSLLRAANAVCRLDAEGGARCTRAKEMVSDAERRVKSCGCQQ